MRSQTSAKLRHATPSHKRNLKDRIKQVAYTSGEVLIFISASAAFLALANKALWG